MIKKYYKARNDNEFLEQVARIIFIAGFRYSVVESKWPYIRKAFDNFSVKKVAKYNERGINRIMKSPGMIRNEQKIRAIVENAQICEYIQDGYGSVLKWIACIKREKKKHPKDIFLAEEFQRFRRIGKETSTWLDRLYSSRKPYVEVRVPYDE